MEEQREDRLQREPEQVAEGVKSVEGIARGESELAEGGRTSKGNSQLCWGKRLE